jgi:MHS family proline/betaine transporter-like MFS transporter
MDSDISVAEQRPAEFFAGSRRKIIAAGAIGNMLEWYDFAVYGYFAASIGRTFFPQEDPVAQVLAAFGIFAVGFLMRPLGGATIGFLGDRFGRRTALVFSMAAMAIPTFLSGSCRRGR